MNKKEFKENLVNNLENSLKNGDNAEKIADMWLHDMREYFRRGFLSAFGVDAALFLSEYQQLILDEKLNDEFLN
jgi:uncharacterized protein Yka (UPF0111/DUF47 family)